MALIVSDLSIINVVSKTDFSSKSEALNIFVLLSLKSNTRYNIPLNPKYCLNLLSSSLIYSLISSCGKVTLIKGES